MASYCISVRRNSTERDELQVIVHDEAERSLASVSALSDAHAALVARDLVTLVRKADPGCFLTLDLRERPAYA